MKIRYIILSWDFVIAIILTLSTALYLPEYLKVIFCASFYNIGITVLSIIFSLFFAALTIIMTSSDNDFIEFLDEAGDFNALLETFKITLIMLFLSLIYSIGLFVYSDFLIKHKSEAIQQHKVFFLVFEFLFIYSLLATGLSVKDTIRFSGFRAKYLKQQKKKKSQYLS